MKAKILISGQGQSIKERSERIAKRVNCTHRHENGNCLVVGGFCFAVDDKYCKLTKNNHVN